MRFLGPSWTTESETLYRGDSVSSSVSTTDLSQPAGKGNGATTIGFRLIMTHSPGWGWVPLLGTGVLPGCPPSYLPTCMASPYVCILWQSEHLAVARTENQTQNVLILRGLLTQTITSITWKDSLIQMFTSLNCRLTPSSFIFLISSWETEGGVRPCVGFQTHPQIL